MNGILGVRFGAEITSAARAHRLDPRFLAAVAAQETGGPGARSGNNIVGDGGHGRGVFQIDDRWHAFARSPAAMDPARNADYAAGMLSGLLGRYHGDVRAALSAYNAGSPTASGTLTTWADGKTLTYADSVLRHYADLGGDAGALTHDAAAAQREASAATGALAGLAASAADGGNTAGAGAAAEGAIAAGALGGGAPSAPQMPLYTPQVTVPQPNPYPSQFRPYTAVSGLDSGQSRVADGQMASLIDAASSSGSSGDDDGTP